jgi:hypothetical protein
MPGLRASEPPPEPPWLSDEDAFVPVGPPRQPLPAAAAALEPPLETDPRVYPTETDAVGEEFPPDDEDAGSGRSAAL